MVEIVFTEQAIADIEEIAVYIAQDSIIYAEAEVRKIFEKLKILVDFPLLGRVVPEMKMTYLRELIEGNYRIIYKVVNKDTIHIITVHHSKRLIDRSLLRKLYRQVKK
jgi:addiction module RelE/StbE family toxin